jgi:hypothetical protein
LASPRNAADSRLSQRLLEAGETDEGWFLATDRSVDDEARREKGDTRSAPAAGAKLEAMYGLPTGFATSRLLGCTLELVSFSENTVHLSFDKDVSITIESCFTHSLESDSSGERTRLPVRESRLMELLGKSIASAHASAEGTLTLLFTNGQSLACFDDTPEYEAYRIKLGDEEIIV